VTLITWTRDTNLCQNISASDQPFLPNTRCVDAEQMPRNCMDYQFSAPE